MRRTLLAQRNDLADVAHYTKLAGRGPFGILRARLGMSPCYSLAAYLLLIEIPISNLMAFSKSGRALLYPRPPLGKVPDSILIKRLIMHPDDHVFMKAALFAPRLDHSRICRVGFIV
ncbi:hypothetical protein VNO77_02145 [Canavalia gladiata]|uniref:Uncharacterized protein n=1 Tax=Canavalia gladiata TaxID=3824 RepID=A0AAN9MSP0_CANGL